MTDRTRALNLALWTDHPVFGYIGRQRVVWVAGARDTIGCYCKTPWGEWYDLTRCGVVGGSPMLVANEDFIKELNTATEDSCYIVTASFLST